MGSGTILREVLAAAELLREDFGVEADVWSAPSFTELRRDGMEVERWNRLHPTRKPKRSFVEASLDGHAGPVVAASDYIRAYPDQIRPWVVDRPFVTLGTDGFGRSDWRAVLRRFFEVDRHHVVLAALQSLGDGKAAAKAIKRYDIDSEAVAPWRR
jgi:pyruvate dehydrogenase E1 component